MKRVTNNLTLMVLATVLGIVLGIAPLQSISASVSDCFATDKSMHHSMKSQMNGKHANHDQMLKSEKHDCCETTVCDMSHCAGFVAIAVPAEIPNDFFYTFSDVYLNPTETLTPFYSSSLYRPPKA